MTRPTDIRLRPLCANGLGNHPPCRKLIDAMIDLGWPLKRRVEYLYEVYGDQKPEAERP